VPADQPTILAPSMGFNRARDPWRPLPLFRYAFDLAGNPSCPKLCFLTTGTGDRQSSIDGFYAAFADGGVDTSHLSLFECHCLRSRTCRTCPLICADKT
jgi:hypothetical protein